MRAYTSSPSKVTMKSRFPKRMCPPRIQSMPGLAIQNLMKVTRHTKGPYLAHQLSVFKTTD
jgi:hypothetical protein